MLKKKTVFVVRSTYEFRSVTIFERVSENLGFKNIGDTKRGDDGRLMEKRHVVLMKIQLSRAKTGFRCFFLLNDMYRVAFIRRKRHDLYLPICKRVFIIRACRFFPFQITNDVRLFIYLFAKGSKDMSSHSLI